MQPSRCHRIYRTDDNTYLLWGHSCLCTAAEQPPSASADDHQRPYDYGRGPRFPVPFDQPRSTQAGNFSFGPIASIQNNETGQPAWIVVGTWRGNLLSFNETTVTAIPTNATTQNNTNGNTSSLAVFNADFRMVMLNGSAPHTHVATNFILSNVSSNENGTRTYTGTSTVSLREGPLAGVPTTIKVSGEVISIFPSRSFGGKSALWQYSHLWSRPIWKKVKDQVR